MRTPEQARPPKTRALNVKNVLKARAVRIVAYRSYRRKAIPLLIMSEAEWGRYLVEGRDVQTVLPSGRILIKKYESGAR